MTIAISLACRIETVCCVIQNAYSLKSEASSSLYDRYENGEKELLKPVLFHSVLKDGSINKVLI